MEQTKPIVHCIYTQSENTLTQLLDEYFRSYLAYTLELTNVNRLSCLK